MKMPNLSKKLSRIAYIKTFGCSLNHSDTEFMSGLLEEAGFRVINNFGLTDNEWKKRNISANNVISEKNYDLVIINTCTVKNEAEKKFEKELRKWKEIPTIITGCIPQAEPLMLQGILKNVSVLGTHQLNKIVEIATHALNGEVIHDISEGTYPRLNQTKVRKSSFIEILPISEGCLSNCTYCKTKFARGNLLSYDKDDILLAFKSALSQGCKEFWITSQDNGCYGFDRYRKEKYFLPQLLNEMLDVEGDFRIRLGMANPDHIKRITNELIEVFKHPKMFKFLHIPVQSGSNKVLRLMKRFYTIEEYYSIIDSFRTAIPDITISTDIIVGFAEENEKDFEDTIYFLEKTRIPIVNISRFWLRKGTAAEKLIQVRGGVSKERSEKIREVFEKIAASENEKWIGWQGKALIDEIGKEGEFIAHNDYYKQILIKNSKNHDMGDFVNVKIVSSQTYHLVGEICK